MKNLLKLFGALLMVISLTIGLLIDCYKFDNVVIPVISAFLTFILGLFILSKLQDK